MKRKTPNRNFIKIMKVIFIVLTISIIILIAINKFKNKTANCIPISYPKFIQMVNNNKVSSVDLNLQQSSFRFKTKANENYTTDNPRSKDFKKFLLEKDIKVNEIKPKSMNIFLNLFLELFKIFIILGFLAYTSSNLSNKLTDKVKNSDNFIPNIKLKDVSGIKEVKQEIQFVIDFLKNPKKYTNHGANLPKGIIFYGPPGTGKTLTAKAIAGEAGVPFFSMSGSDFVELYVGLGAKKVRDLFKEARKKAPCIIFIDEIDAVGTKRGQSHNSEKDQTINALLSEMDGFTGSEGVMVISATNRIEDLDNALIRPGRFDKHIAIPLPDYEDRLEIIKKNLKNKNYADCINLFDLSKLTIGFSGAGLASLINEATIISISKDKKCIDEEDIDDAYFKIVMKGHKKENKNTLKTEEELIAWHEAGHALCSKLITDNDIPKVTIIPSTSGAGGVTFITPKKMGLFSKNELINDIKVSYAGRIAEYLLLGDKNKVTTGASNDIEQATLRIKNLISIYGMNDNIGLLNLNILKDDTLLLKESSILAKKIYDETLQLLTNNKGLLNHIANTLLNKETLSGDELDYLIQNYKSN